MKIAVFLPNWIGDVVMATPAIAALWQTHQNAQLIAVGRKYVYGVIEGSPWFDHWLGAHGRTWTESVAATAYQLRKAKVDTALLFPNSFRSAFTAYLGGCKQIIGYARDRRTWMLTDRLNPKVDEQGRFAPSPVIDAYNELVTRLGVATPGHQMQLFTTSKDETQADQLWEKFGLNKSQQVVVFNPGAAYGSAKLWPVQHFARLAQKLTDQHQVHILVLCGPTERELARTIVQQANRHRICSLADAELSIGLLKACVKRCDFMVTTDSGPRHFAAAFNKPVVTLFGPTHIAWTETYHPLAVHLQKKVHCGPCQLRVCPLQHECMTELSSDEVYAAVASSLARLQLAKAELSPDQRKRA